VVYDIPRVYRFLWSGREFPDLYGVALTSVLTVDPEARVVVHSFGARPQSRIFDLATADERVEVFDTDPASVFGALPAHLRRVADVYKSLPQSADSARSNLLRYAILYNHGGVYLDFDTITLRPVHDLADAPCVIGAERVWSLDEVRVAGDNRVVRSPAGLAWLAIWAAKRADAAVFAGRLRIARRTARLNRRFTTVQPNNAVIAAVQGAEFLDRLLRAAHGANPMVRYSTGPTLVSRVAHSSPHLVTVLDPDFFYQVEPAESFRYFTDATLRLHPNAAIIHYVGSNSRRFLGRQSLSERSILGRVSHLLTDFSISQPLSEDPSRSVESLESGQR